MTRVFRNREEAEAEGFALRFKGHDAVFYRGEGSTFERAIVRSPLEAQLAEALEACQPIFLGASAGLSSRSREFRTLAKATAALKEFRGEAK